MRVLPRLALIALVLLFLILLTILQFAYFGLFPVWKCPAHPRGISQICSSGECIPPLQRFEKRFRLAPRYKLNFCAIEKNLSTVMTAILCFLFDEEQFRARRRSLNGETFPGRLCKGRNEAFSMEQLERNFNVSTKHSPKGEWLHLAVVRDPLDRFVSGFVDKCVLERSWLDQPSRCNGCRNNMSCFLQRQYSRMRRLAFGHERLNSFDDRHFFPQSWRCHFNEYFRLFTFLPYSSSPEGVERFFASLFALLRARGVSEQSIQFIQNQTTEGRTPHSTWKRKQRQKGEKLIRESAELTSLVVRMYYHDFLLFGFSFPSF